MQDTSLPNATTTVPTHVDDYQPPQSTTSQPTQPFNAPAPPPTSQAQSKAVNPNPPDALTELDKLILKQQEERQLQSKTPQRGSNVSDSLNQLDAIVSEVSSEIEARRTDDSSTPGFAVTDSQSTTQLDKADVSQSLNELDGIISEVSTEMTDRNNQRGDISLGIDSSTAKNHTESSSPDVSQSLNELDAIVSEVASEIKDRNHTNESFDFQNEDTTQEDQVSLSSTAEQENMMSQEDQSLEAQNIFDLLGVSESKSEEKEAFLDELQEVIWEDFVENDVELLLSKDQVAKLREMQTKGQTREIQEEMLVYLEELLPDLEDIMMDKALELKEDMVLERISGMKEFYSDNQAALDQIAKAEELISDNKWAEAGKTLNAIK